MKEIEFRAYCKSLKRMLSYEHLKNATKGIVDIANRELAKSGLPVNKLSPYGLFLPLEDDDLVFMQFTGLFDKNGNKIFEGDIISCAGCKFVVKFGEWNCGCCSDVYGYEIERYQINREIIGNIYDNPELLEGV